MEKFYRIEENHAEIILEKELYPVVTVQKAVSNFLETTFVKILTEENHLIIQMALQEEKDDLDKIVGEFYNELLRESLRYNVSTETRHLRELIVGRALYTTCIDLQEEPEVVEEDNDEELETDEEEYDIDDIAVNWFENEEGRQC